VQQRQLPIRMSQALRESGGIGADQRELCTSASRAKLPRKSPRIRKLFEKTGIIGDPVP
jgi:hypothetical protein